MLLLVVLPLVVSMAQGWLGGRMVDRQLTCANKKPMECFEWAKNLTALQVDMHRRGITVHPHMSAAEMGRLTEVYQEYGIDFSAARTMTLGALIFEALLVGSLAGYLLRKNYHVNIIAGASFVLSVHGATDIRFVLLYAVKAGLIIFAGLCVLWYRELPD